jgi:cyclophilin family peptidyl-prolyl cis-trans isomerase
MRAVDAARATSLATFAAICTACAASPEPASEPATGSERRALLRNPDAPEWSETAPAVSRIAFETTKGVFVVEVIREWAPHGADRFYNLARLGFYDDARITRVIAGYIAQFGLHGDPAVTAAWRGRTIPADPPRHSNGRGTIAFAMITPDARNTQVYINLVDNPQLDAEPFAIFGRVSDGMAVVDAFYSGYGDASGGGMRAGRQGPLEAGGAEFIDREYPLLDRIIRAQLLAGAASPRQPARERE